MTCADHGSPQADCIGCLGRWDRALAQRAIDEYLIYGIAKATIRGALAEVDRLTAVVAERDALAVARNEDRTEWMTTYEAMRAELESLRCGDLDAFHDGELTPERAAAFRLHLGTCAACQSRLHDCVQFAARVSDAGERRSAVVDAAVAWRRRGGTLAELAATVDALEDNHG